MAEGSIPFNPIFKGAEVVEVITENFVTIHWYGMNIIYSVKDQKFNASKLVSTISNTDFRTWSRSKDGNLFKKKYPEFFVEKTKVVNRLKGTYLNPEMIYVIVAWANPMIGFHLTNGRSAQYGMEDKSGYIYLVQPEKYLGKNIYKVGRTWKLKQRLQKYGKKTIIIKTQKVTEMFAAETKMLDSLKDETISNAKLVEGAEYFEVEKLEDIVYYFNEAAKEFACE
jgi:hypothetical protein